MSNIFKTKEPLTIQRLTTDDDVNKLMDLIRQKQDSLNGAIVILLSGNRKYYETYVINLELGDTIGALDLAKHDIEHNGVPRL